MCSYLLSLKILHILQVAQNIEQTYGFDYASSGHAHDKRVKTVENSTSVILQEFLTVGLLPEKVWYFKKGVPT